MYESPNTVVDIVGKFHPERKGMYTCWYWGEYSGKQKLLSSFFGGKKAAAPSPSPTPTTAQVPAASITAALEQAGPSTLTSHPPQTTAQPPPRRRAVSPTFDPSAPDLPLEASEPSNVT
ncbi:hypothetical protein PQX77_019190 [Marasmius sp. AFHP31]|nr:hypothetical protein PQX77_019190 [Marasmius sp. AFHP31]